MTTATAKRRSGRIDKDLGLQTVERAYEAMSIDDRWSHREERGFTWWGHWIRERIWADQEVRSDGERLWHVRAQTPSCKDVPDEPATYRLVNDMNSFAALSAYTYDPDEGTISSSCGAFVYDEVAEWLQPWLLTAAALQTSMAWVQVPTQAEGLDLDDEAHPSSGPRKDPDDMLNAAGAIVHAPCPVDARVLKRAAEELAADGLPAACDDGEALNIAIAISEDRGAFWTLRPVEHPFLGPGLVTWLVVPPATGPQRAAWIANALNAAESADWSGEARPHALGAWREDGGLLCHISFLPSQLLGRPKTDAAMVLIRNLLSWGAIRAQFAGERLPWLESAAASRYPDDEPPPEETLTTDGAEDGGEGNESPWLGAVEDSSIPIAERGFGPAARTPRPRTTTAESRNPRELIVDQTDADAYPEIDAAVASAEDGDTIIVRPGTYREPVVVDRSIRIEGRGPRADIVLEPAGAEALGFAASGAVVSGLTIRPARVGNDGAFWSAVAFHDASGSVEDCHLSTHQGATIWVGGPSTRALIRECDIADGAQNPVWVTEEARAEIVACRISGHRWPAIVGGEHATLILRDSEVIDNLDHGVVGAGHASLVVEGCTVARNAASGIYLLGAAPASRIEGNVIEENAGTGVLVEAGRGRVVGNRIHRHDVGVGVMEGATPTLADNELAENGYGIGVRGPGTDPQVSGNTISGCRDFGIIVEDRAAGSYKANCIRGCSGPGIRVDDEGTAPSFVGNHVADSIVGVHVTTGAGGEFRSNDLRTNRHGSWLLHETWQLARADNLEDAGLPTEAASDAGAQTSSAAGNSSLLN